MPDLTALHGQSVCAFCGASDARTLIPTRAGMQICHDCTRSMATGAQARAGGGSKVLLGILVSLLILGGMVAGGFWAARMIVPKIKQAQLAQTVQAAEAAESSPIATTEPAATSPVATPAPIQASTTSWLPNLFNDQSRRAVADVGNIHLLFVSAPGTDHCMGMASRLYATREAPGSEAATLATKVGDDMKTSFDEGIRYVRKLPRGWEKDFTIRLSFEDKFTPKDGGSAGTGFTIAMLAAIQNVPLDADIAVTGDLTIDGSVQPVGAVVEKLRGAIAGKCRITLIPERNAIDAQDLALLDGTAPLWETQIFSIASIDEALSLARRDRPEAVKAAIARFDALRARLPAVVTPNYLGSPIVQTELREILRLAPHHLSAAILLRASAQQLPSELSLERSLEEILGASYIFIQSALPKVSKGANSDDEEPRTSNGITVFPEQEYIRCMNKLYSLTPMLEPRAMELKTACIAYAGAVRTVATYKTPDASSIRTQQQYAELVRREKGFQQQYRDNLDITRSKLLLTLRKFSTDTNLRRELRK